MFYHTDLITPFLYGPHFVHGGHCHAETGMGLPQTVATNLEAQNCLCFQFCGNSFWEGLFLFQHDNAPMHKARSIQKWFVEIGVEELACTRALTSTPSNTFGMNWNADCEPGLNAQKSVPDLTNARG